MPFSCFTTDNLQRDESQTLLSVNSRAIDPTQWYRDIAGKLPHQPFTLAFALYQLWLGTYGLRLTAGLIKEHCSGRVDPWTIGLATAGSAALMAPGAWQLRAKLERYWKDFANPTQAKQHAEEAQDWFTKTNCRQLMPQLLEILSALSSGLNCGVTLALGGTKLPESAQGLQCIASLYDHLRIPLLLGAAIPVSVGLGWQLGLFYSQSTTNWPSLVSFLYVLSNNFVVLAPLIISFLRSTSTAWDVILFSALRLVGSKPQYNMLKQTHIQNAKEAALDRIANALPTVSPEASLLVTDGVVLASTVSKQEKSQRRVNLEFATTTALLLFQGVGNAQSSLTMAKQLDIESWYVNALIIVIVFLAFIMSLVRCLNFMW